MTSAENNLHFHCPPLRPFSIPWAVTLPQHKSNGITSCLKYFNSSASDEAHISHVVSKAIQDGASAYLWGLISLHSPSSLVLYPCQKFAPFPTRSEVRPHSHIFCSFPSIPLTPATPPVWNMNTHPLLADRCPSFKSQLKHHYPLGPLLLFPPQPLILLHYRI